MKKLSRQDLMNLETYAERRPAFRAEVMEHKKHRRLPIGPEVTLYFEDRLTIQYQVQEMLRAERIFQGDAIQEELDAYNPLIPDGSNWKATFMVEIPDVDERRRRLTQMIGIEDRVWMQVAGFDRVYAISDEDLEREDDTKTSSVHFCRFELDGAMAAAAKAGAAISAGVDHDGYRHEVAPLPEPVRAALVVDLD